MVCVTTLLPFCVVVVLMAQTIANGDTEFSVELDRLIRDAKEESNSLAAEINSWTVEQTDRLLSRDITEAATGRRPRRSVEDTLESVKRSAKKTSRKANKGKTLESKDGDKTVSDAMLDLMKGPMRTEHAQEVTAENKKPTKDEKTRKVLKSKLDKVEKKKSKLGKSKEAKNSKKSVVGKKKHEKKAESKKADKKVSKKVVLMKGVQTVTIDHKTMKIIKKIPKSLLHKLLKKSKLDKYLKLASFLSIEGNVKKMKKGSKQAKDSAKRKTTVVTSAGVIKKPIKLAKVMKMIRAHKLTPAKPVNKKKNDKKEQTQQKEKKNKINNDVKSKSKSKIVKILKSSKKLKKDGRKAKNLKDSKVNIEKAKNSTEDKGSIAEIAHLKEQVKRANSLKFKVAKALLAHCETQNKLKKVFEKVNASLMNAAKLAKVIGNKYGIKQKDVEKITTLHTQSAVEEFLQKIF
ncbi:nucleolar protein 58 [Nematostella vectensis]|uniref:nucleolar protein 58 n=1 Tax=Nematostella vectensis TaxID=45351 RepID=UPI0020772411|nr:nucleolar protein 58 [Nematostella vectensis]